MRADVIKGRILADGDIRIETDPISPANHVKAQDLMDSIQRLAGGMDPEIESKGKHAHHHVHTHTHQGQTIKHSH